MLKGIIFDMDNTILTSNIDFPAMKRETYRFLVHNDILPDGYALDQYTTSTIIEEAARTHLLTEELREAMWQIPKKYELIGMKGATLEPGATELLRRLSGQLHLAIVTNNSVDAAKAALSENHILEYFDLIVGRELMHALKPSSDGYKRVLETYKEHPDEWLSVGDSWIDGAASRSAGIKFIAYRSDREKLKQNDVHPIAEITHLTELIHLIDHWNEGMNGREYK